MKFFKIWALKAKNEACLYYKKQRNGFSYIAVYVDDLIIISPKESDIEDIKGSIATKFDMKDGGQLSYFLGMEISREGQIGPIKLCQKRYIENLLRRYGMQSCRLV